MKSLLECAVDFSRFDFESIFGVVKSTENMKQKQMLFLRTHIQEISIAKYSNNQLIYIGDKSIGKDFRSVNGVFFESKAQDGLFMKTSPLTKSIALRKFFGKTGTVEQTFDFMILWDTTQNSVGICSWEDTQKRVVISDTSASTRIEKSDIIYLKTNAIPNERNIDMMEEITNLIEKFI